MSFLKCDICGIAILDNSTGHITECEHWSKKKIEESFLIGKFYPEIKSIELYRRDFPGMKEPKKVELDHIIILFNKFKITIERKGLINNDYALFKTVLNKVKANLDNEEIELLNRYAIFLYDSLIQMK